MLIKYIGKSTVRLVGNWRWDITNKYTCDVLDAGLVVSLLSQPDREFVIANNEPILLINGIGTQRAAELALFGIVSIHQLANLTNTEVCEISARTSWSERQIAAWVKEASKLTSQEVKNE